MAIKKVVSGYNPQFKMNLQLFADTDPQPQSGEPPAAQQNTPVDPRQQAMAIIQAANAQNQGGNTPQGGQTPTQGQPQPPSGDPQVNLQNSGQPQSGDPNQPNGNGQPGQQAQPPQDLILGKFKSPEEVVNAYANLEQFNTKTRQDLAAANQQNQALQQALEQMKAQMNNVINPQQNQGPTPEEINEQLSNSLFENPSAFVDNIRKQTIDEVMKQIAPMQQYVQAQQQSTNWNNALNQFVQSKPDFDQWKDTMSQIVGSNQAIANMAKGSPQDMMNALEITYNMAKGQNYQDPNAVLSNNDAVLQHLNNNPEVKNQIIQDYLKSVQSNTAAPTVIAGQTGGATPTAPINRPTNGQEARAAVLQYLQQNQQN